MSAASPGGGASSAVASVFLAGPEMRGLILQQMYPVYQDPARFQVLSMAAEWDDVKRQVSQYRPEALVIDAGVAPSPDALRDYLTQMVGTIAVVVLPTAWAEFQGLFQGIQTSVRSVHLAPPNWAAVASATYSAVMTERTRVFAASPTAELYRPNLLNGPIAPSVVGTRTIAFTSFAGGTGKSTIAETMAVELARQHVKTLLCSFNSPPAAVGHMGLRFNPNANEWLNRPTVEGFAAAVQRPRSLDDLEVLLAPNDPHSIEQAHESKADAVNSIQNLVFAAYSFNYGAILLDLPPFADSMWAMHALLTANVAVLVCRPTLHDQFAALRAYRLLTEQLATQVRVPQDAIFAVLNFATSDDNMNERDFQGGIMQIAGRFPPILATFPYISKLPAVQNRGDTPAFAPECEMFARSARTLTTKLIGGAPMRTSANGHGNAGFLERTLGIRVKIGK
jgi:MinD-like ATPase involved in chromosome partitioning or flagellar assembly